MTDAPEFVLSPHNSGAKKPWAGGEPRVFTVTSEDKFPERWTSVSQARLVDVTYQGGGITEAFREIAAAADVAYGSFQALLENLEDLTGTTPLVVCIRRGDRLLADVGPALIDVMTSWERFARHPNGVSAMYLVIELGPRAVIERAHFPGGAVDWLSSATLEPMID